MNALEAKIRALQKRETENWNSLPLRIQRAIEEAVDQGRMICYVKRLPISARQKLDRLRYKIQYPNSNGAGSYLIEWYHP